MPRKGWKWLVLGLGLSLTVFSPGIRASGGNEIETKPGGLPVEREHEDLTDLARHLNNPVGPVWNIVTQNNWYFQKGFPSTAYRVQYVLNFQPVLPIPLTRELNLVMRPVVPLESTPYASGVDVTNRTVEWSRAAGIDPPPAGAELGVGAIQVPVRVKGKFPFGKGNGGGSNHGAEGVRVFSGLRRFLGLAGDYHTWASQYRENQSNRQ
jgi:hypothetical protein